MSPTVLVADDSRTIRQVVEMALKAAPFEVVGVGSAREAMEAAGRAPSVILLDYHMPDGSGFEVCRALKNNGNTANIPIIILGGNAHGFNEEAARGAGADDVVMKPFKTDTLLNAIEAVAEMSQTAQAAPSSAAAGAPPAAPTPTPGQHNATPQPSGPPATPGGGPTQSAPSRPRIPVDDNSGARRPTPRHDSGSQPRLRTGGSQPRMRTTEQSGSQPRMRTTEQSGSQPRMRTTEQSGSQPRMHTDGASQPRIPDANQTRGGSQPRISTPDVNASTRAQEVSQSGAAPTGGTTNDSGVSNIGMSRAEIETMVKEEVKRSVKAQLPGLLRNIMGEVFQQKVLPKLLEHGEQRVDAIVQQRLGEQIREAVRVEIERLLAED